MRTRIILLIGIAALVLHVLVGWAWSPIAAVAGGFHPRSRGWLVGSIGVGLSWTGLVLFNLFAAPAQVVEMARVVGSLVGGMPDWSIFFVSAMLGFLLGAAGGLLGQALSEIKIKINAE